VLPNSSRLPFRILKLTKSHRACHTPILEYVRVVDPEGEEMKAGIEKKKAIGAGEQSFIL
jgi:hypothetical protein